MPGDGSAAVVIHGLARRYGDVVAVADVGFTVERGELFGVLGPNGSGKTTTLECVEAAHPGRRPLGGPRDRRGP